MRIFKSERSKKNNFKIVASASKICNQLSSKKEILKIIHPTTQIATTMAKNISAYCLRLTMLISTQRI